VEVVGEERALEVRERGLGDVGVPRRQLLDAARREPLQVLRRSPQ
jgi:hypothetical protein